VTTSSEPASERASEADPVDQERSVDPEPQRAPASDDPEAPVADAADQATEVAPGERIVGEPTWREANEADVWEQSQEVPLDDERRDGPPGSQDE
jgi:hypothetical protein